MIKQLNQYLKTSWLGKNIIYEEIMESTNKYAKKLGEENVTNGTVVVTKKQTAGRGRRGRNWISPEGNCYFSLLLKPSIQTEHASRLTLVSALALAEAIKNVAGLETQIKWPNDVVVDGKKLCGILTESSIDVDGLKYVVIGIGINVNQKKFDPEIDSMATSISLQLGQDVECAHMIAEFLNCFEMYFSIFIQTEDLSMLLSQYNALLVNKNREVRIVDQSERVGVAIGINDVGELLVRNNAGVVESVNAGEVSVRGLYGYV
ncbi:MAG: biotin--[acetyl-CoA-carboxylase] ligase [Lachnospiraceae bacterium]|nr:biotin--[acetyl-CoA-carboxylase] ligase [Lachnospiraceae bacterium]